MALTEKQKEKMLRYIGWNSIFIDQNKRFYSATIDSRLNSLSTSAEEDAIELLTRAEAIDTQLSKAVNRLSVNSIGNLRLNRNEITELRAEQRRLINEMITVTFIYPPEHYYPEVY